MSYKTYAEAKIANPDSEIVTTSEDWDGEDFFIGSFKAYAAGDPVDDTSWVICNPADYCSSLKEFLEFGFKLIDGDVFIGVNGNVITVIDGCQSNIINHLDSERYMLSASALNGCCKVPAKAEQWTVYNNTLPLCELTDEQAAMLFNAWRNGDNIQYRTMNVTVWIDKPEYDAVIKKGGVYRVKSKSERELFIEHTTKVMRDAGTKCPDNHEYFGIMFDAGARYKDLTQYFGENI